MSKYAIKEFGDRLSAFTGVVERKSLPLKSNSKTLIHPDVRVNE